MSKTSFHYTALLVDIGNVNKCVCSYISRDIRSDQLEHTLLRVPILQISYQNLSEESSVNNILEKKLYKAQDFVNLESPH